MSLAGRFDGSKSAPIATSPGASHAGWEGATAAALGASDAGTATACCRGALPPRSLSAVATEGGERGRGKACTASLWVSTSVVSGPLTRLRCGGVGVGRWGTQSSKPMHGMEETSKSKAEATCCVLELTQGKERHLTRAKAWTTGAAPTASPNAAVTSTTAWTAPWGRSRATAATDPAVPSCERGAAGDT